MGRPDPSSIAAAIALLVLAAEGASGTEMPPFPGLSGDSARGRALVVDRRRSFCLLCHSINFPAGTSPQERFMGDLAPPLDGAGSRWSADALRFRLVDSRKLNPETIMPAYHQQEGQTRVARAFAGQTILTAQEIEDIVAYLGSLKE